MGTVSRRIESMADALAGIQWVSEMVRRGLAAGPVVVTLGRDKRSTASNRLMWALLTDVARDVEWYGQHLSPEDWKNMFTAGLKKQRVVPGIESGFVVLGASTSKMTKEEFSELVTLIQAFGDQRGVKWSEP